MTPNDRVKIIQDEISGIKLHLRGLISELTEILKETDSDLINVPDDVYHVFSVLLESYNIKHIELLQKSRECNLVECRHVIIYFIKEIFKSKYSNQRIALMVGLSSHCNIYSSVTKINNLCESDKSFRYRIADYRVKINRNMSGIK